MARKTWGWSGNDVKGFTKIFGKIKPLFINSYKGYGEENNHQDTKAQSS